MSIAGQATPEATRARCDGFPHLATAELGRTGWYVSQAGFGAYRIDERVPDHREALRTALRSGINLIDTSANYTDGHSERLIGQVIAELIEAGELTREALVVVSKGGYIQGGNMTIARQRAAAGRPFPEVVTLGDDLWHCLHPEFLADQIQRSLDRLGLATLDVYLLHNPEYFLKSREPAVSAADRQEYERRLQAAFRFLETQVAAGTIAAYGISSNSFPEPAASPTFTSLERCWELAEAVSPEHHFRVVQWPANVYERGFVLEANQSGGRTVLELARELDLGVLINRPLNAFANNTLIRLADTGPGVPLAPERLAELLAPVKRLEAQALATLPLAPGTRPQLQESLVLGALIEANWSQIRSREHWQDVLAYYLGPRLELTWHCLSQRPGDELDAWMADYRQAVSELLSAAEGHFRALAHQQATALHQRLEPLLPSKARSYTLSQLAIDLLRSLAGVDVVLVGMRRPAYVADVLTALAQPPITDAEGVWRRLTL